MFTLEVVYKEFQSTLPYGSDITVLTVDKNNGGISIHAPLRERRPPAGRQGARWINFNPRSLTGATASARAGGVL